MIAETKKPKLYIPLEYSARFKRNKSAGLPFFLDNLGDDLLMILLAFIPFSSDPVTIAVAICFFHFSFWTVYEIGYFENDKMSEMHEHEPKVTPGFDEVATNCSERHAWIWALALAIPGSILTAWVIGFEAVAYTALIVLLSWGILLGCLRAIFYFYNRTDKLTRVWLYLPLQILKYGFPAFFFPLPPAGAALIFSQCLRRWAPYIVYRFGRKGLVGPPPRVLRLVAFCSLWLLFLHSNFDIDYVIHGSIILLWLFLRGFSQLREVLSSAKHVRRDLWSSYDV